MGSTYAEIYGHFDFNSTPLAILGTKAKQTSSYAIRRQSRWYGGPYMHKYRNYCVFVDTTYSEQKQHS